MPRKNDPTLAALGEWGFLDRLLPRLQRRAATSFLVPPGDDAAVLSGKDRTVLSIDGLTEGTHFRSSWDRKVRGLLNVPLGRALAWKLLGSCVSDLAAMGNSTQRWAMIYLGAPGSVRISFLEDLYAGTHEAAARQGVALAGGDTVRAREMTVVAAVGGLLKGRPLLRRGARVGMKLCLGGSVGDAGAGLQILDGKKSYVPRSDAKVFVRRFFDVRPQLELGARLSRERGVGGAMDVSDALSDCISIFCRDSGVGVTVNLDALPMSAPFRRHFSSEDALSGGEDYVLLFAADAAAARRLQKSAGVTVIGEFLPRRAGIDYRMNGKRARPPAPFEHFA